MLCRRSAGPVSLLDTQWRALAQLPSRRHPSGMMTSRRSSFDYSISNAGPDREQYAPPVAAQCRSLCSIHRLHCGVHVSETRKKHGTRFSLGTSVTLLNIQKAKSTRARAYKKKRKEKRKVKYSFVRNSYLEVLMYLQSPIDGMTFRTPWYGKTRYNAHYIS